MSDDEPEVEFVPCAGCGAPVLPNLAECLFCGRKDPGLTAEPVWLPPPTPTQTPTRPQLRSRRRRPALDLATPLRRWQANLARSDLGLMTAVMAACGLLFLLSLLPPGNPTTLYRLGATGALPWAAGRWWTPLTAVYLHAGVLHLIFNLLWLFQLGPLVGRLFGRSAVFLIFTAAGVCGAALSTLMGTPLTVGASGGVFGLLGALTYVGLVEGRYLGQLARRYGLMAAVLFLIGLLSPQVDNWSHLGGLLGGVIAAMLLLDYPRPRWSAAATGRVAWLAALATLAAFVASLALG